MFQPTLELDSTPLDTRPTREPRNQPVFAPVCLVLGSFGAIVATLAEIAAKQEVSVTVKLKEALVEHAALAVEPIYVIGFFVFLGAVMTFVSQTRNYYKAFYAGASILTIFMTVIPTGLPPTPSASTVTAPDKPIAFRGATPDRLGQLAKVKARSASNPRVDVTVATRDKKRVSNVVMTLRDQHGRLASKGRFQGGRFAFSQSPGTYRVVIDVPGYRSQTKVVEFKAGQRQALRFELQPTWQPVILQRLFRKY